MLQTSHTDGAADLLVLGTYTLRRALALMHRADLAREGDAARAGRVVVRRQAVRLRSTSISSAAVQLKSALP